jgi:hypothetical protein
MLYQVTGRQAAAAAAIDTMLRRSPAPETYAVAAQLWEMFGEPEKARAARRRAARPPG